MMAFHADLVAQFYLATIWTDDATLVGKRMTMSGNTESCPTLLELSEILSGQCLVDAEAITLHLETCARCAQLAETVQVESDLERMIRSRPPSNSTDPLEISNLIDRVRHVVATASGTTTGESASHVVGHSTRSPWSTRSAAESQGDRDASALDKELLSILDTTERPGALGKLGHYQVLKLIGRGGMGVVFLAEDSHLQRQVALKVLIPGRAIDPQQRERFLREARAAAGVKHENVVTVYQVDVVEGPCGPTPYLAMEMLEGETLDHSILRGRHFTAEDLRQIGEQIAAGLAAAHARGLIHRDIKPANVFVESIRGPRLYEQSQASTNDLLKTAELSCSAANGPLFVKLLDFGLALPIESCDGRLTQDGFLIGTPAYMSPEQASCLPLDPRSDLFSLGSLLYQLATGRLPFNGASMTLQLAALLNTAPRPVQELNPALPRPLASLIMQLLQRDPNARPASAADLRDRLRTMVLERNGDDGRAENASRPSRRPAQLRRMLIPIAILVCCGLIFLARNRGRAIPHLEPTSTGTMTETTPDVHADVTPLETDSSPFIVPDLDRDWYDRVVKLPAIVRTNEVKLELQRRNPGIGESILFGIVADRVREVTIDSTVLDDIAPLVVLRELQSLRLINSKQNSTLGLKDLRPLQGLKLKELLIEHCPDIVDFSPLHGMPLTHFSVYASSIPDATWFARQKQIETVNLGGRSTPLDLNMLKHLPLVGLELNRTTVSDLTPIAAHRLEMLRLAETQVTDLSPLQGQPLVRMDIRHTPVTNFEPLQKLDHLTFIMVDIRSQKQIEILRSLKSLRLCNQQSLDALDGHLAGHQIAETVLPQPDQPIADWLARVQTLPVEMLVAEVRQELFRRNPGLEGSLELTVSDGQVFDVSVGAGFIADLGPIAALKDLQRLRLGYQHGGSRRRLLTDLRPLSGLMRLKHVDLEFCPDLRDLTPLYDKPLERLSLYATPLPDLSWISSSRIRMLNVGGRETPTDLSFLKGSEVTLLELNESETDDLSPLQGLPLQFLSFAASNVTDLTPLRNMPLSVLNCQDTLIDDLTPLKTLPTLRKLRCDIRNQAELEFVQTLTWVVEINGVPRMDVKSQPTRRRRTRPSLTSDAPSDSNQNDADAAAREKVQEIHSQLQRLNPGYSAKPDVTITNGRIVRWEINSTVLNDISPLADLADLENVRIWNSRDHRLGLKNLTPLRGKKLKIVSLNHMPDLRDLSPVEEMRDLEDLALYGVPIDRPQWLGTLKLKALSIGGRETSIDLAILKGMPLTYLNLSDAPFEDLSALSGMSLETLKISGTKVSNLAPIKGMPLRELECVNCPLNDLSQLRDLPQLRRLVVTVKNSEEVDILRMVPTLTEINLKPASEVLGMAPGTDCRN